MDGPWMDTVTVISKDTWTEEGRQSVNPWTLYEWHSNSGIHAYLDRGGQASLIHGWSTDGQIKCMSSQDGHSWMVHGYGW